MTAYNRPSYLTLVTRIAADLAAMPAALREPLTKVWAQMGNGLHGHLDWLDAQCSPLTCEMERLYDWATLYAVPRLLATAATGNAIVTGSVGSSVLAGTLLRGANGLDYQVLSAVVLGAGGAVVALRCTTAGAASNVIAGATLTLVNPLAGVNSSITVDTSGITGGADDELVTDWRIRVIAEWQQIVKVGARSGKPDDYRFWARSAHPSVTDAIVRPHALGVGTVVVQPVCNSLANRLSTQGVLNAIVAKLAVIAPAVADWRVGTCVVHPITLSIHLLPASDTAAARAAIQSALNTLVLSKGTDGVLSLLWAEVDTSIAMVTSQYTIDESVPIVWAAGEIPVLQPIVWI